MQETASFEQINTLGYRVFSDSLSKIELGGNHARVVNTISPNSYGLARKDPAFDKALKESDFLVLDGVYFAFASILMNGKNIKRNQGPDVFQHFMERLNKSHKRAFFLGSTDKTLELIRANADIKFPNIKIETYSPPFKDVLTPEDNAEISARVNSFQPDILFVGMTCPKQEKWAVQNRGQLSTSLIVCIGNVFDWFAGTQKKIHPVWFKLRLAWLVRIFLRPEIFRRNIGNQMFFFRDTLKIYFSSLLGGKQTGRLTSIK
jgi:N-acetylglucosaminyldiphosphoundecaprenol N-acetyl-beta-D-mannosaminyltransferase